MLVQQFLDGILLSPAPTNQLHDPLRPEFLGGAVGVNRRSLFVPSTFDHHGPNLAILVHRARGLQGGDRFGFPDLVSHLRHPVELLLRQIVHPFIGIFGPTDEQRPPLARSLILDRKSTRLNSSHGYISYAVFCLKKKKTHIASNFKPISSTS